MTHKKEEGKRNGEHAFSNFVFYAKTKSKPGWQVIWLAVVTAYSCATARDLHPVPLFSVVILQTANAVVILTIKVAYKNEGRPAGGGLLMHRIVNNAYPSFCSASSRSFAS